MDELIRARTSMPVQVIEDGMKIEPNQVFLNVARRDVEIRSDGTFSLSDGTKEPTELHHPINTFFRSLAKHYSDKAIGIILSGTGSDGATGVVELRKTGGLVIVQDPKSAEFDGMPLSTQKTGVVDLVLKPTEIGAALGQPNLDRHTSPRHNC